MLLLCRVAGWKVSRKEAKVEKAGGTQLSSKLYSLVIGCEMGWGLGIS